MDLASHEKLTFNRSVPRTRGRWTYLKCPMPKTRGFPARAGMDPTGISVPDTEFRRSRPGMDPTLDRSLTSRVVSARTRGDGPPVDGPSARHVQRTRTLKGWG